MSDGGVIFFDPPDMDVYHKLEYETCRTTAKGTGVMFNNALISKDSGTVIASGNVWLPVEAAVLTEYKSPVWIMKRWIPGAPKGTKPEIIAYAYEGAVQRELEDAPKPREGGWSGGGGGGSSKPLMTPSAWEAKVQYVYMFLTANPPEGLDMAPQEAVVCLAHLAADAGMSIDRSVWALPDEAKNDATAPGDAAPAPPAAPPTLPDMVPPVEPSNVPPPPGDDKDLAF